MKKLAKLLRDTKSALADAHTAPAGTDPIWEQNGRDFIRIAMYLCHRCTIPTGAAPFAYEYVVDASRLGLGPAHR
jgi:hypothetical protein